MKIFSSPHIHIKNTISNVMFKVILALIPATLAYIWFFGWGIVFNLILTITTALIVEAWVLALRKKPILPFLLDGSAIVTAWLIALAIPSLLPWWIPVVGTAFAMIFAKHLYGGLGYNPFNPAMVAYAVLLISLPQYVTLWPYPQAMALEHLSFLETFQYIFTGAGPYPIDSLTGATLLDKLKMQPENAIGFKLGNIGWEWLAFWYFIGGLFLVLTKVISWRIPVSFLAGLILMALIFHMINPQQYIHPFIHLVGGSAILGAFFIATDPVSASTTPKGQLIYGLGIGILIYIIRTWGAYPDGVAFAVLLMNIAVPLIDSYTQPRVYGQ